jgi:hypothetical protein
MCELLNAASKTWPAGLIDRARVCAGIAEDAKRCDVSNVLLPSAATKFMWFLQPDGWTVHDSLARSGLHYRIRQRSVEDMVAFYETLELRGFVQLTKVMNATIRKTPFRGLPAERIIDMLLMARGRRDDQDDTTTQRAFLNLLPEIVRTPLIDLASTLQADVGNDALTTAQPRKARR